MQFGKNGCSTIEIDQLTPICSYPTIDGTTPLTLDVPVPTFLHPVPPNECACFEFTSTKSPTTVNNTCTTGKQAESWMEITQADPTDCCTGKYTITPHVEVPCIPFDLATAYVRTHAKDGSTDNVDGALSVEIDEECCTIQPIIDLTLPKCIKNYTIPPDVQIGYLDHGIVKTHKFMTMKEDEDECTVYPEITPVDLPCPLANITYVGGGPLSNLGGYISICGGMKDCEPWQQVDVTPIDIVFPTPCFCDTSVKLHIMYKDSDKATQTLEKTIKMTACKCSDDPGCFSFCQDGDYTEIDLTGVGGGGGAASGGDVNPDDDDRLWIDGSPYEGKVWYMGGIGDRKEDAPFLVFQRGKKMRNDTTWPTYYPSTGLMPVPTVELSEQHMVTALDNGSEGGVAVCEAAKWRSNWAEEDSSVDDVTDEVLGDDAATASIGENKVRALDDTCLDDEDYANGNLSIVMPTAFQWHDRGVAAVLSHFMFNAAGVLSGVYESYNNSGSNKSQAVLLAPAPAVMSETSGTANKDDNASGLAIMPADVGTGSSKYTTGLTIKAGDGLRIFNIDDGTTPAAYISALSQTAIADMQGELEIHYGPGFKLIETYDTQTGAVTYNEFPNKYPGALVPNDGRGLRVHGMEKMGESETTIEAQENKLEIHKCSKDFEFHTADGSLVLNDKRPSGTYPETIAVTFEEAFGTEINTFRRDNGTELTIPILIPMDGWLKDKKLFTQYGITGCYTGNQALMRSSNVDAINAVHTGTTPSMSSTDIFTLMSGLMIAYLHISESGLVLGWDFNGNSSAVKRHANETDAHT